MRRIVLSILLVCLFGASLQGFTHTQILAAVNLARTNPKAFAETAKKNPRFFSNGAWVASAYEANCHLNTYNWLVKSAPVRPALLEAAVAVFAAFKHSKWLALVKKTLSHTGENNSQPLDRLKAAGTFASGSWAMNENIAMVYPAWPSANDWVFQWIADCGQPSRGHRNNIYSTSITHYGCAEYKDATRDMWYATCDGTVAMNLNAGIKTSATYREAGLV